MNQFGHRFRVTLWGESHGRELGVVLDGVKPGIRLDEEDFYTDISRRQAGRKGTTPRHEADVPHLLSGVYQGKTTGAPLTIAFENGDVRSDAYLSIEGHDRPSHADRVAWERFGGCNDVRGGGHFSGRLTLLLVAAGVVAKKMLPASIQISSSMLKIGAETNPLHFDEVLQQAISEGDSVGGKIECKVEGVPMGWGEPFFDSVESVLAHLLFSIPAVKGVEFGSGFGCVEMKGSEHNDMIINQKGETKTNHAGGVVGGLSNGAPLVFRVAVKPTPSISREQMTFNRKTQKIEPLSVLGRHDVCIALRAQVVVEAAAAIVLADLRR